MSSPVNCGCGCATPLTVNIPGLEGDPGEPGTNGTNGVSSFTLTTADFDTPLIGQNVTVSVVNSTWMVVGQILVFAGPASFLVISKPTSTSVILQFLGYENDVAEGVTIPSSTAVGPSGVQPTLPIVPDTIAAFGAGSAYELTATPDAINMGTTDPAIVINQAGTWNLFATVRVDYAAATFAANQTVSLKFRRTNNTAGDIANGAVGFKTEIITTLSHTAALVTIGPIPYSTGNIDDAITLYASIDVIPSAGTIDVVAASISAVYVNETV